MRDKLIKQGIEYGVKQYEENYDYCYYEGANMNSLELAEEFLINNAPVTITDELWGELHQEIMDGIDRKVFPEIYRNK